MKTKRTSQGVRDLNDLPGQNKTVKKLDMPPTRIMCKHINSREDRMTSNMYCPDCGSTWDIRWPG